MLEGKRTKTGAILLIIAGALYIGGLYDAILYDIGIGLAMMGAGLVAWGMHHRVAKGLCNMRDGKILYNSMRMQPPSVMGE
ncbi:hypothetical protein LCGC14_1237840 [marine sediment metagenome]|uniref:Uncharacterized protein n=1 Tax=marine sediment metagenome TaxID=412755 RepID=A0A0F9L6S5_9ZZZZ